MKNVGKWMKRNWVTCVTYAILLIVFAWWIINYDHFSTMILAIIGSYKLGEWFCKFSTLANDKILGDEKDED